MIEYLIDGNNLIGKNKKIKSIQIKDKQMAREKIFYLLDDYFTNKNVKPHLFFDGYENAKLNSQKIKIHYSGSKSADELIKNFITNSKNRRNLIVISSDRNIIDYAKVCSCSVITAEDFEKSITKLKYEIEEEEKIKLLSSKTDDFKKLFGVE